MEWLPVLRFRRGPFKTSSSFRIFRRAAAEFFELVGRDNPVFDFLSDDICGGVRAKGHSNYGSDEHAMWVCSKCRQMLVDEVVEGGDTKKGRWWDTQLKGRKFRPLRSMSLMIFVVVGVRKGWRLSLGQVPAQHDGAELARLRG